MDLFDTNKEIIKTIEFNTCGQLYEELKKTNPLYENSPSDGVTVRVEYVDTFVDNNDNDIVSSDIKTMVAIHGNLGNYKHFKSLINNFGTNGSKVRVIVPNMPDFSITRETMAFWHSNQERIQFIRDFLNAIKVSTIDCLVSHSAGVNPISGLWTDPGQLTIRSIALCSPQCGPVPLVTVEKWISYLSQSKWGIAFFDLIRPHILTKGWQPIQYTSVDEVFHMALVQSSLQLSETHKNLEVLKRLQIPTLLVFGDNDSLFPIKYFEEFAQRLSDDKNDFVIYSENNGIENDSENQSWIKILQIKGGRHFCFGKHMEEVAKHLVKHCFVE